MTRTHCTGIVAAAVWLMAFAAYAADAPVADAAMNGDLETVRELLAGRAEVNAAQGDGMTALHWAAFHDDHTLAQLLLEAEADVAAALGNNEMVEFLVARGATVHAINAAGNSPADMAFGPSRFFIPKPETADLLVGLGSSFQNNCRSDQCVDGKFFGPR